MTNFYNALIPPPHQLVEMQLTRNSRVIKLYELPTCPSLMIVYKVKSSRHVLRRVS